MVRPQSLGRQCWFRDETSCDKCFVSERPSGGADWQIPVLPGLPTHSARFVRTPPPDTELKSCHHAFLADAFLRQVVLRLPAHPESRVIVP